MTANGERRRDRHAPFDDGRLIVNLSTWESLEALADYVYRSAHTEVMRNRRRWFQHIREMCLALWWVPAGHRPSVAEDVMPKFA